jgi:P2 family phage contractile tail tube protein
MLPKILRNFAVFVDGRGYAGKIEEITLPKLTIKTEDYRAGGMDVPVAMDMGMEKLETEMTFADYDAEIFKLFGIISGNLVALTLRGALQEPEKTEAVPMVLHLRGTIRELDFGVWKAAEKATLKMTMDLRAYKLVYNNADVVEIDAENMIRKINGTDQLSSFRTAIGL